MSADPEQERRLFSVRSSLLPRFSQDTVARRQPASPRFSLSNARSVVKAEHAAESGATLPRVGLAGARQWKQNEVCAHEDRSCPKSMRLTGPAVGLVSTPLGTQAPCMG